jgi:hypothetical protein
MSQSPMLNNLLTKLKGANRRLIVAMACYLALILVALYGLLPVRTSNDRFVLGCVLLVFALLIVRTIVHASDDKSE